MTDAYQPFGPEWEAFVMKMRKRDIVALLKQECQKTAQCRIVSTDSDEAWQRETIKAMLAEQDLAEVREIIEKGGSAQDVLNFLDTPKS